MRSLDNEYVTWIMYIIFIHFKADICSGISRIIFALAGKNLPVCIFWSLRSKTFPLGVNGNLFVAQLQCLSHASSLPSHNCVPDCAAWSSSELSYSKFPAFSMGSLLKETLWLDFRWSLAEAGSFSQLFKHCLSPWLTSSIELKEESDERKGGSFQQYIVEGLNWVKLAVSCTFGLAYYKRQ